MKVKKVYLIGTSISNVENLDNLGFVPVSFLFSSSINSSA